MRSPVVLSFLLLVSWTFAAPNGSPLPEIKITEKFFNDTHKIYTAQHDIVNIYVPVNREMFEDLIDSSQSSSSSDENDNSYTIYFVEADVKENGEKDYKGLYVYDKGTVKEILSNGRDTVRTHDKNVYFGATDGLYKYNAGEKKAVKYGTVTDSIIQLATDGTNGFCYLTTKHEVYCYANAVEDTPSYKVEDLKDVQEMVFSNNGHLFFYNSKNEFFMFNFLNNNIKQILAPTASKVVLVKPPFKVFDEGALAILDNKLFYLDPSGTAQETRLRFEVTPTAYAPEATFLQFYAFNKKLYSYNVLLMMLTDEFEDLKLFFDENMEQIRTIAKSKNASV